MPYSDRRLVPKFAKVPDGTEVAMARSWFWTNHLSTGRRQSPARRYFCPAATDGLSRLSAAERFFRLGPDQQC